MNKGKEMKRAVLYLRVSKHEQTIENQRIELERVAAAKSILSDDAVDSDSDAGRAGSSLRMMIAVKSKCGNVELRQRIRKTWGKEAKRLGVNTVFLMDSGCAHSAAEYLQGQTS